MERDEFTQRKHSIPFHFNGFIFFLLKDIKSDVSNDEIESISNENSPWRCKNNFWWIGAISWEIIRNSHIQWILQHDKKKWVRILKCFQSFEWTFNFLTFTFYFYFSIEQIDNWFNSYSRESFINLTTSVRSLPTQGTQACQNIIEIDIFVQKFSIHLLGDNSMWNDRDVQHVNLPSTKKSHRVHESW